MRDHLPSDLANPDLVHTGIFADDGTQRRDARVVLSQGPATTLVIRAIVLSRAASQQHLQVIINARMVVHLDRRRSVLRIGRGNAECLSPPKRQCADHSALQISEP